MAVVDGPSVVGVASRVSVALLVVPTLSKFDMLIVVTSLTIINILLFDFSRKITKQ